MYSHIHCIYTVVANPSYVVSRSVTHQSVHCTFVPHQINLYYVLLFHTKQCRQVADTTPSKLLPAYFGGDHGVSEV